ncbi:alpha-galactosidase [Pedobacter sp. BAL39]|uniref:alpha-galactosidase n=1 Tax=Pedobacter sp. BAL39 TaxID=391596 RepID=UPI00030B0108|nr:alpha-galactosidase [Pedobacter sp. BAL39]
MRNTLSALFAVATLLFFTNEGLARSTDPKLVTIPYGVGSKIVYHLNSGTYDVLTNGKTYIYEAFSQVKNKQKLLSSKDYQQAKLQQSSWKDSPGGGKKYTITLSRAGLPDMKQVFYVSPKQEYFLTEVLLSGMKLSSNYMAALISNKAMIHAKGDNRSLFVPFDNDAFVRYNARSTQERIENVSSELGALYENNSRKGMIVGSVEHMVWKSGIRMDADQDELSTLEVWGGYVDEKVTRDKQEHGAVSGELIKSPLVFVGYFTDWRLGLEAYGKANRLAEKPYVFNWKNAVPFGWNSWGVIQEKLNYEKATKVVDFFADQLPDFRNGNTAYIDLDSFWDNLTGGMSGDYTKLKAFADYCKSKGLEPGAYWAPFTDWGFQGGGNGTAEGSNYKFREMWTKVNGGYHDFDGARALDPTHPGTRARIDFIIGKLKECGFKMIKIDFLGHAAAESTGFYDPAVTTGMQAYRSGMEYLIDRMEGQMLVYAAISPNLATGRYAHIRRIACDAWKTINDTEYTLNSVNYGWWQSYLYNFVDADHVVFANESEGANRARLTSALITGTLILGDDFSSPGQWSARSQYFLKDQSLLNIARSGDTFIPVDGNTGDRANELFVRRERDFVYVAVLNYGSSAKGFHVPLSRLGLKEGAYSALELFSKKELGLNKTLDVDLEGSDAMIIKIKI